jgi:hypothetical protein
MLWSAFECGARCASRGRLSDYMQKPPPGPAAVGRRCETEYRLRRQFPLSYAHAVLEAKFGLKPFPMDTTRQLELCTKQRRIVEIHFRFNGAEAAEG